jgi:hypothetical protein
VSCGGYKFLISLIMFSCMFLLHRSQFGQTVRLGYILTHNLLELIQTYFPMHVHSAINILRSLCLFWPNDLRTCWQTTFIAVCRRKWLQGHIYGIVWFHLAHSSFESNKFFPLLVVGQTDWHISELRCTREPD